ncbi:phosphoglucomutase/phosphomannomutase, alpha/beta/alpha domain I family protein, partial [Vibrio cholerae HC-17A1]
LPSRGDPYRGFRRTPFQCGRRSCSNRKPQPAGIQRI